MHLTGRPAIVHCIDVNLDVCMLIVVLLLHLLGVLSGSSSMDRVLPHLVKVWILSAHAIVQNWSLFDCLEDLARLASMNVVIAAWAAHLDHVHHILCVRVLLLPQVEQFEFLPHWRFVAVPGDIAEGAE